MIALEILKSDKFQSRPVIRDNFNRESSACFSRSGAVIHSGTFRSTCFIPKETPLYASLKYWVKQEQSALDAWVDAVVSEREDIADRNACKASRHGWKFTLAKRKGWPLAIKASRPSGKLVELQESHDWKAIHYLTK